MTDSTDPTRWTSLGARQALEDWEKGELTLNFEDEPNLIAALIAALERAEKAEAKLNSVWITCDLYRDEKTVVPSARILARSLIDMLEAKDG